MSTATDLVTAATAGTSQSVKTALVVQGILDAIAVDVAAPGADQASLIAKLNARIADFGAQKANLAAATIAGTPISPQPGVRPLVF